MVYIKTNGIAAKHCRYSHVRIIENTDARVVLHWRTALPNPRLEHIHVDPVTGWAPGGVRLLLGGKEVPHGKDFRVGYHHTLEGTELIVWIQADSTRPVKVVLEPRHGQVTME